MPDYRKKISATTTIYLSLLSIYIVYCVASSSYLESVAFIPMSRLEGFCRYVVPIVLMCNYIITTLEKNISLKRLLLSVLLVMLLLFQLIYVKSSSIINTVLFMISYPVSIEPKRLARKIWPVYFMIIAYIVISCRLGLIENYVRVRGGSENIRVALGFVSANALANTVAVGYLVYAYYKIDKWQKGNSIISVALVLVLYFVTYSRYATMIILLVALVATFYKKLSVSKFANVIYFLSSYLFCILFVIVYFVTMHFSDKVGSPMYLALNIIFSTRLRWMIYYFNRYGFSLVGQPIELVGIREAATSGTSWMGLDNAYMMIPIHYGIVFLILFAAGYCILGKHLKSKGDLFGAILCIIIIMQGLTENYIISIQYNFTILLFAHECFSPRFKQRNIQNSVQN